MTRTYAALVAQVGRMLYGQTWVIDLHRATGWTQRNLERIKAAAAAGDDYPAAKGYLDGLQHLIEQRQLELEGMDEQLAAAIERRTAERTDKP